MSEPLISLYHCTARPHEWDRACRIFRSYADHPERCEYVMGIHRRQNEIPGSESLIFCDYYRECTRKLMEIWPQQWILSVNPGKPNNVQNINHCGAHTSGKVIVPVGDFLRPCRHWDSILLEKIPDLELPYMVAFGHGNYLRDSWIVTWAIVTRAFYEKLGYLAWPEYTHYGCDDDLTLIAKREGCIIEAPDVQWPYLHWFNGMRQSDSLDSHTRQSGAWQVKEEVFARRKTYNFEGKVVYGCHPAK